MRIYLAAPYGARDWVRGHAATLRDLGFEVTSSWLDEQHEINAGTQGAATALSDDTVAGHALQDLDDVEGSDLVVLFTAAAAGVEGGGGRHVETGYAIGCSKPVVVVGEPENVFHRLGLPLVQVVSDWGEALVSVQRRYAGECVVCGCGEYRACDPDDRGRTCWWVEESLCSRCQPKGRAA